MEINKKIKDLINENEVFLFMKGTPDSPECGFSMAVSNILKHLKVNFKGINVLDDEELRKGIKEYSDWPTIPQLYVKNEFVETSIICDKFLHIYNFYTLDGVKKMHLNFYKEYCSILI